MSGNQNPSDRKRYAWIVICLALAAFMTKLNTYIVNIALPTIADYFSTGTNDVSQTVIVYLIAGTSTLLFFGKLGDRLGLRTVFIAGYVLFTVGSLLCGISWNIPVLVLSRFIQGLGGAMLLAAGYAIIPRSLPSDTTGLAFGILTIAAMLGIAVGAPLGGVIVSFLSWHGIFLINVPLGLVAILVSHRALAAEPSLSATSEVHIRELDPVGTIFSLVGVSAGLYGLTMGGEWGWTSGRELCLLMVAVAGLGAFVAWEMTCGSPLLDFELLRKGPFLYANIVAFFGYMLMAGHGFLMPFYLQWVKGMDAVSVGLFLMIYSIAAMIAGPLAGALSDRIHPGIITAAAMLSAALCAFYFAYEAPNPTMTPVTICTVWLGLSYGAFVSPNNNQVMKAAPSDKQGIASGLFNTINTLGLAVGVALFEMSFAAAVPQQNVGLIHAGGIQGLSPHVLLPGFRDAYILGGVGCLAAMAFSIVVPLGYKRRSL